MLTTNLSFRIAVKAITQAKVRQQPRAALCFSVSTISKTLHRRPVSYIETKSEDSLAMLILVAAAATLPTRIWQLQDIYSAPRHPANQPSLLLSQIP